MFGVTGLTGSLAFAIFSAAMGSSFQFGYSTGIVNAPAATMKQWLNESTAARGGDFLTADQILLRWSFVVSLFAVGGMIGGLLSGSISTQFGRKGGMVVNNALALIAGLLMGFSKFFSSWEMLLAGRLLIGINAGINTGLAPMYLTEIAPVHLRGAVGTIHQLVVTISILISQVLGLPNIFGNARYWDLLFGFVIVPAVFQILTLPFCPESPRFLFLYREREDEAHRALVRLRNTGDIGDEMEDMRGEREVMKAEVKPSLGTMLNSPLLRWALTISILMMISQQITGINAVMYYSTSTFRSAGMTESAAQTATIVMGVINVLMTVVSMLIVDKAGRRTLHMTGLFGMAADTVVLVIALLLVEQGFMWMSYVATLGVIMFVVFFATGPGSIPWFFVAELFTQGPRSTATGVAVTVNWLSNFLVGQFFELLRVQVGAYVFLIFTFLCILFGVFTWLYVPETKNKTIDEIQSELRQKL